MRIQLSPTLDPLWFEYPRHDRRRRASGLHVDEDLLKPRARSAVAYERLATSESSLPAAPVFLVEKAEVSGALRAGHAGVEPPHGLLGTLHRMRVIDEAHAERLRGAGYVAVIFACSPDDTANIG
jgi:hypothetical protein